MTPRTYLFGLLVLVSPSSAALCQTTWYVDDDSCPIGDGSQGDPYCLIQEAIDAAVDGDTVVVEPGTYQENLDTLGKSIVIRGAQGPAQTVVDGGGLGSVISILTAAGCVELEGLTIMDGRSARGAGVFCAFVPQVTITDCVIADNCGFVQGNSYGGGVYATGCSLSITNTLFSDNQSDGSLDSFGGGMYANKCQVEMRQCTVRQNEAVDRGHGLYLDDCVSDIEQCVLEDNIGSDLGNQGGGAYVAGGRITLRDCLVQGNVTYGRGGGLYLARCLATMERCTVSENNTGDNFFGGGVYQADGGLNASDSTFARNCAGGGGGVYLNIGPSKPFIPTARFTRCRFFDNVVFGQSFVEEGNGGGLLIEPSGVVAVTRCVFGGNEAHGGGFSSRPGRGAAVFGPPTVTLRNCTVESNTASATFGGTPEGAGVWGATLENCIVWNNDPDNVGGGGVATYSNVEGGWPGAGNINLDPLFWDAPSRAYYLRIGSPCVDAGNPSSPHDLDGSISDVGAFELLDCNWNGVLDSDDIIAGTSVDGNGNGTPDECECYSVSYCAARPHSEGPGAGIATLGTSRIGQNDLVLVAADCPMNKSGIFFYGSQGIQVAFGDGFRCVGGGLFRYGVVNTGPAGQATFVVNYASPPQAAGQITAGSFWNFQFWFRDPMGPGGAGFNLSNAVRVSFCP